MKAKYIFRGLGLGIIITAVVMGAYTRDAVADARVKVLKEYGIGEEAKLVETLVDAGNDKQDSKNNQDSNIKNDDNNNNDKATEVIPAGGETQPQTAAPGVEPETKAQVNPEPEADVKPEPVIPEGAVDNEDTGESKSVIVAAPEEDNDKITVVITKGDDSGTVSRKLHSVGLVDNAKEFDAFLIQHGYDKRINTGTKTFKSTDSWQELADKLAR